MKVLDLLVLSAPVLWILAYSSYEKAERKKLAARTILTITAIAAIIALAAKLADVLMEAGGTEGMILQAMSGSAMLVVVAPFVIFPIARLLCRWATK
jgi:hypothetical protein